MERVKLGEIIEKIITGEWGTEIKKDKNDIYVIRTADFCNNGKINYDKVVKRNITKKKIKEKSLVIGDIIVEKSGGTDKNPVGRVVLFEKENYKCLSNNFTQVLRIKSEYYYKYIFYQLFYKYKCGSTLQMFNKTTGIQNLQMKVYLDQKLNICDKKQQIKITTILDKVQEIIDIQKRQIEEFDGLIKSQFVEMFGDIKSNDKNWKTKKGSELFIFSSGKGNITSNLSDNFEYKCYGGNGITGHSKDYLINYDTIVIGRVGAYCGSVHKTEGKVWITDNAIYIKEFKEDTNIKFLEELFKVIDFHRFANFSGQPKITQQPLQNYNYILPPIELQKQFADIVKQIDKQKFEIQKSLEETQKLQESLMNKYFG